MSLDIPTKEPEIVRAGETLQWTRSLSDYPATEYSLVYELSGPSDITITATAYNTTDHLISATAATTLLWTYGIYEWSSYAEKGAGVDLERYFIGSGFITIKTAAGKSFAKTMLDGIEAILEGRATSKDLDLVAKNLGGASISRDPDKLMKYRDKFRGEWLSEVANENRAQGKSSGNKVLLRLKR